MGRKQYSKEFKAQGALDTLRGHRTVVKLASEGGLRTRSGRGRSNCGRVQWIHSLVAGIAEL